MTTNNVVLITLPRLSLTWPPWCMHTILPLMFLYLLLVILCILNLDFKIFFVKMVQFSSNFIIRRFLLENKIQFLIRFAAIFLRQAPFSIYLIILLIFNKKEQASWFQTMEFTEPIHAKAIRVFVGAQHPGYFSSIFFVCYLIDCASSLWIHEIILHLLLS